MRCLLIFFALLACAMQSAAAPPACTGQDMIDEIKSADATAYKAIQQEANSTPNGGAILWKIEKNGTPPSYLFGTAHLADPRVTNMSPEAIEALNNASVVALELAEIRDKQLLAMSMMRFARFMAMPTGQTLWDVIPDADEAFIKENPNLPPGRSAVLGAYQPWVVAVMIAIPLCAQQQMAAGAPALDEIIAHTAVERSIRLVGLESIGDQLSVFASMPMAKQAEYLVATAKMGPRMDDYFETLISQYVQRRITSLIPLSKYLDPNSGNGEALAYIESELIEKRNRNMHTAALDLLQQGNAFIAVGALHLPGSHGLVELIRSSGYTVSPIN